jgi:D-alanine-D-alanine ligase
MKIAVIYNLPETLSNKRDALADEESYFTANAVKKVLEPENEVSLIRVTRHNLSTLRAFEFVFNLAENCAETDLKEDEIARYMEKNNVLFSGAGAAALSLCIDKGRTKEIILSNNLLTPKFQIIHKIGEKIGNRLDFPLIIKPLHEDGSIGIEEDSICYDESSALLKAKKLINRFRQPVILEEYIDGREINAAILGEEILPLSEIIFDLPKDKPKILTYACKWETESDSYQKTMPNCPAELDEKTKKDIELAALNAAKLLGCRDYTRVDFRIDSKNNPYIIEVNPNPCINPQGAGFLKSASVAGYSFEDIIKKIIQSALKRKNIK